LIQSISRQIYKCQLFFHQEKMSTTQHLAQRLLARHLMVQLLHQTRYTHMPAASVHILVELFTRYLDLMCRKSIERALACGRSTPHALDVMGILHGMGIGFEECATLVRELSIVDRHEAKKASMQLQRMHSGRGCEWCSGDSIGHTQTIRT
jgi:hypothetical protein